MLRLALLDLIGALQGATAIQVVTGYDVIIEAPSAESTRLKSKDHLDLILGIYSKPSLGSWRDAREALCL